MPKNFSKVLLVIFIELGSLVSVTVILAFTAQICKQIGLNNLGLYVLVVNAATATITTLLAPSLFAKYRAKSLLIVGSFGIAMWIIVYTLPIACAIDEVKTYTICNSNLIYLLVLSLTVIGGTSMVISFFGLFIYIVSWAELKDIPLFQGFIGAIFSIAKVLSSILFSLTMTSATAQVTFFACLGGISLISAILLNFISDAPKSTTRSANEIALLGDNEEGKQVEDLPLFFLLKKISKSTLNLAFSKKMLMLLPFFYFTTFVRDSKLSLIPLMINHVMEGKYDRFTINQKTGYVSISDGIIGSVFGIIVGLILPIIGKKITVYIITIASIIAYSMIFVLGFIKGDFGVEWYIISACISCCISAGMNVQLCIYATDFPNKEQAVGAGNFLIAICSVIVMSQYSLVKLIDYAKLLIFSAAIGIIGTVFIYRSKLVSFTKKPKVTTDV